MEGVVVEFLGRFDNISGLAGNFAFNVFSFTVATAFEVLLHPLKYHLDILKSSELSSRFISNY